MKDLKLESLKHVTLEEFAPFGRIIGRFEDHEEYLYELRPQKPMGYSAVITTAMAYWDVLPFKDTNLRFSLGMSWIKNKPEGACIEWAECHLSTYEIFFPLGGKEMIFVLAPPGPIPDINKARAFLVGPDEGILLNKGTWHVPPHTPGGIAPIIMLRYGEMAEITGPITEAFGKKFETPQPLYRSGALHAMETYYYGNRFDDGKFTKHGDFTIRLI